MAEVKRAFLTLFFVLAVPGMALAAPVRTADFTNWLQNMEMDAVAQGVTPDTAQSVLAEASLDEHVIELDQKQPENTVTFANYIKHIVTPERVAAGQKEWRENAALLNDVSSRYGVPPEVIIALWGVESSFGHNSGDYSIIDSLVTLAYEGRRANFFRGELIDALRILDQQHIAASKLRGSWAGAMGQCQFMPSTYLRYAASYTGGTPDIWDNTADVFTSIANYILADGWNSEQGWGIEVTLTSDIPDDQIGLSHKYLLSEWARLGIRNAQGADLTGRNVEASLIAPDGSDGRHFLVYDNFRALMRWNHSTFFAASVGILADRIK